MSNKALIGCFLFLLSACGDNDSASGLDRFLPEVPEPTGEAQSTFAFVAGPEDLIGGPGATGQAGDFVLKNESVSFIIEDVNDTIGTIPFGGNIIDATYDDQPIDQFGEFSFFYKLGRSCIHDRVEILQDGSEGGVAAIRAFGVAGPNLFLNIKATGLIPVDKSIDPDREDGVECATTYILAPASNAVEVYWTLYNGGEDEIKAPVGTLVDVGAEGSGWAPGTGFKPFGLEDIDALSEERINRYLAFHAPEITTGAIPEFENNTEAVTAGISLMVFGITKALDLLAEDKAVFNAMPGDGATFKVDYVVGKSPNDIAKRVWESEGTFAVTGQVTYDDTSLADARIAAFADTDSSGDLSAEDAIVTFVEVESDGSYAITLPNGEYFLQALAEDKAISPVTTVNGDGTEDFVLPKPVRVDYTIEDVDSGNLIPGRVVAFGELPFARDNRVFDLEDRRPGIADFVSSAYGTTVDVGDGADRPVYLPVGNTYRIFVTRGNEWFYDDAVVTPTAGNDLDLTFSLERVIDTDGFLATEYHVHQSRSPDSNVPIDTRVATALAEGIEVFAATDHNYVQNLQPLIEEMGRESWVRSMPGVEATTFAYGHFNVFPINSDSSRSGGSVDFHVGEDGFAMSPAEMFEALGEKGAKVFQVNHPRRSNFQGFFDVGSVEYDLDAGTIVQGDFATPLDFLRLSDDGLLFGGFNALEVWNSDDVTDSNGDGVRELGSPDLMLADWFTLNTIGMVIAPIANSDSHKAVVSPMGTPRTYVEVADDSSTAVANESIVTEVTDNLSAQTPLSVVMTNGPFVRVVEQGTTTSALGRVLDGTGGSITLEISVDAPGFAPFDTLEIFANETPEINASQTALTPLLCLTSRDIGTLAPSDTCLEAPIAPTPMILSAEMSAGRIVRYTAEVTITINESDIPTISGQTGTDAWLSVRARGSVGTFPLSFGAFISGSALNTVINGSDMDLENLVQNAGVPANATTSAIYVDFDGGGYRAVLAP